MEEEKSAGECDMQISSWRIIKCAPQPGSWQRGFSLLCAKSMRAVHQTDIRGFGGGAPLERGATIAV